MKCEEPDFLQLGPLNSVCKLLLTSPDSDPSFPCQQKLLLWFQPVPSPLCSPSSPSPRRGRELRDSVPILPWVSFSQQLLDQ